jgi:hypothetical protein
MIYTIERRYEFESTAIAPERHYEVRSYERRTPIGVLVGCKTLKTAKTMQQVEAYLRKTGIKAEKLF